MSLEDAIGLLLFITTQGAPTVSCPPALDLNLDQSVNLADGIVLLERLFGPGSPPDPFPSCGFGNSVDLFCDQFECP